MLNMHAEHARARNYNKHSTPAHTTPGSKTRDDCFFAPPRAPGGPSPVSASSSSTYMYFASSLSQRPVPASSSSSRSAKACAARSFCKLRFFAPQPRSLLGRTSSAALLLREVSEPTLLRFVLRTAQLRPAFAAMVAEVPDFEIFDRPHTILKNRMRAPP